MKKRIIILFVLISTFLFMIFNFSCKHESDIIDTFPEICFEAQVLPIFQNSCALSGCHDGYGGESGYKLNTYSDIVNGVDPGNPGGSAVYTALSNTWSEGMMPPSQPLSLENRIIIRLWIEQGALNTTCPDTNNSTDSSFTLERACFQRDIFPVIQSSCALSDCHDAASEEVNLTTYSNILTQVSPNNAAGSKLYKVITENNSEDRMPPVGSNPLTQAQIDSIYAWINYGALDENCGDYCDTISIVTFSEVVGPLVLANCKGCHTGSSPSGEVKLDGYNDVSAIVTSGQLHGVLRAIPPYSLMPPSGSLTDCQIRQLELWIADGYLNN
jgi:hypothetical protein